MINRVVLVGRITRDPELRHTSSNIPVLSFTLAVNRPFADQSGERQADFINCVAWRRQAENIARYVKKGALLGVDGRIQTGSYESEQGIRYTTDVVCDSVQFLESRSSSDSSTGGGNYSKDEDDFYESSKSIVADDDLPF